MKFTIANRLRFNLYVSRIEKRTGVCSKLYVNDNHVLLWDFDNSNLEEISIELELLMSWYRLPKIYIIESSENHYHAYSFTARPFSEVIHILSGTKDIDLEYLRLGMVRGYYTLRFSRRLITDMKLVKVIQSKIPDEVSPHDVTINEYYTTNMGVKNAEEK